MPDIDLVETYLASVRQHDLLTAEQEVALAKIIELGVPIPLLQQRGIIEYDGASGRKKRRRRPRSREVMKNYREARNMLVVAHLKLVVSEARRMDNGSGMKILDLIQAGNLGLINATERWDWRKGNRFATYAIPLIRRSINQEVYNHFESVGIPAYMVPKVYRYQGCYQKVYKMTGESPTLVEMSYYMDLPLVEVQHISDALKGIVEWAGILNESSTRFDVISQLEDTDNPLIFKMNNEMVDRLKEFDIIERFI